MVGTRASAPISAAIASIPFPITAPTRVAASAVLNGRSKYAGRTRTRSEMPRFVQSRVVSSVPSTRRRSGTGSIPQLGVSCKGAGSVPATVVRASLLLAACAVAFVAAGCGSKPKPVTKTQYEQRLQRLGDDLVNAGSQIGQHLDIASFNQDIDTFQDHLRDASKELKGVQPPLDAQGPNERLADAFHDLADALEPVKDARRQSLREAGKAFAVARASAPAREGRAAVRQLRRRGYD